MWKKWQKRKWKKNDVDFLICLCYTVFTTKEKSVYKTHGIEPPIASTVKEETMTDSKKIDVILNCMQKMDERMDKMDAHMQKMDERMDKMDAHMQKMDERMDKMDARMDTIESQIKQSERVLKNEIRNSENLILDEVERVHKILEKHKNDNNKHIA